MDNPSILIVDDDRHFRKTLCDIFRIKGYIPLEAETGTSALELIEASLPLVALIDIKLTDMSGLDVLKQCRLSPLPPECILLTGYASQGSAIEAINSGAYSYVQKPCDIEQLLVIIRRAIEKREAEFALRESEEKYRTLVQAVPDLITTIDAAGIILFINRPFSGCSVEELVGTCFYAMLPAEQQEQFTALVAHVFASKQPVTYEHMGKGPAGDDVWYSTCAAPIQRESLVIAITLIARDITERKQAEQTLRDLNAQLEDRVKKRTEKLEEVNQTLNDFAYIVSHDLKAPLRGIARLSEWLVQDYGQAFDADGTQMIELLRSRVLRMNKLIDGILRYSRAGRRLETVESIELNRLVKDVVDSIIPSEQAQIAIDRDLPMILGDPIRLEQVFQNLLSNAVKFMDKPEGKIAIRCEDKGAYWIFSVADNGPGIDVAHHERVFQIFQTLVSDEDQQNTGIGLALVKKIIELHGGRVWIESQLGSGSTFYFTVPKHEVP